MIHVIIVTHGNLGAELLKSAEMIAGEIKGIDSVSLLKEDNPLSFEEKVIQVIEKEKGQLLFLADIFGGTPYNTAVSLLKKWDAWIVTGVNLPMVLEAATTIEDVEKAKDMAENLLKAWSGRIISRETLEVKPEEKSNWEEEDL
ncbi:MAG: PTS sugar transporter subunit IIA [Lachnoclostridium edouardi]|uniref:PTS sugar transporter subunit IIA n=1 Tax=Lachnoclostridium edouardi TaxID=1926283 RepID=UPI0026DB665A|nr:PTS sugar transporter subunit IIA [Lachnoclostridium edouardi]MDO4278000.1 PTS sugar transporter subunit IIA [Lachnoclostridium edouardi]